MQAAAFWIRTNPKLAWWCMVLVYLAFSVHRRVYGIFSKSVLTADLVLYCVFLAVVCVPLVKEVKVKDFTVSPFDVMPTAAEIKRNEAVVDHVAETLTEGVDDMSAILVGNKVSDRVFRIKANLVAEVERLYKRALSRQVATPSPERAIEALVMGEVLTKPMGDAVSDLIKLATAVENGRHLDESQMAHLTEYGPKTLLVLQSVPA